MSETQSDLPARPTCAHCEEKRPAVCWGRYEDMTEHAYACNECCGHGCEDGHCDLLEEGDCPKREDGTHCNHWRDGDDDAGEPVPCCACGFTVSGVEPKSVR